MDENVYEQHTVTVFSCVFSSKYEEEEEDGRSKSQRELKATSLLAGLKEARGERQEGGNGGEREGKRGEKKQQKNRKQLLWRSAHNLPRSEDSVPVNSPLLHIKTLAHYYYFLHHVCRPVSYRHRGRQQNHCRPITNSPAVISNSCFLIISIILTYPDDALNSSCVKQCALSVQGCEHSVAH